MHLPSPNTLSKTFVHCNRRFRVHVVKVHRNGEKKKHKQQQQQQKIMPTQSKLIYEKLLVCAIATGNAALAWPGGGYRQNRRRGSWSQHHGATLRKRQRNGGGVLVNGAPVTLETEPELFLISCSFSCKGMQAEWKQPNNNRNSHNILKAILETYKFKTYLK